MSQNDDRCPRCGQLEVNCGCIPPRNVSGHDEARKMEQDTAWPSHRSACRLGRLLGSAPVMNLPPEDRPDVGCVVKLIAIIGALAVLALVVYMGGVA